MSEAEITKMKQNATSVSLGTLIGRELRNDKVEQPTIKYGQAALAKKGEDCFLIKPDCQRIPGNPLTSFSVFAIFDGHNGISAAIFAKENLLNNVLSAIPEGISREEWLQALPRALVAGFGSLSLAFIHSGVLSTILILVTGETSGTTVTFVVIDGWTITVASVGDSRCILDTQGGVISLLTVDHRLEENEEERQRVTASGGQVGRLNVFGGNEVGPLRCWPGGLCLSRSIGDTDVGEFIVPVPHVKQVKISNAGGRLIIASDGIWDALTSDLAAQSCRGLPAELAAKLVVKEAVRSRGLKDDTTCLVVDIIPYDHPILPPTPRKKQNLLTSFLFRRRSQNARSNKLSAVGVVEELFEEGSAMLAERLACLFYPGKGRIITYPRTTATYNWYLQNQMKKFSLHSVQQSLVAESVLVGWTLLGKDFPLDSSSGLFRCAVCQADQPASEGLSVNSGPFFSPSSKPWEGPFLCATCRRKKDAMEGKRPSRPIITA
uniref:protein-serine/threonine phosphatase n=1 Tax=Solanum lycopersicum TaxID=4081 RepID=A0A3Q7ENT9_SOLLC